MTEQLQKPQLDHAQAEAARHFDSLAQALMAEKQTPGLLKFLLRKKSDDLPKGLYVWGNVGRGKTMLMDRFYESVPLPSKRRIHFHSFMQEVHVARTQSKAEDVIADIADHMAAKAKLLCLDEMQVSDIADAMILGRLFEALLKRGVFIVTTSNSPPDELYRDGLNRQLFLPFIAKLNAEFDVVHLDDGIDYRLGRISEQDTYLTPLTPDTARTFNRIWDELADGEPGAPVSIAVLGRQLKIPKAAHSCACFSFAELCEQPLGAADYLALARHFQTIFIEGLRILKATERNEAKRLILAIDTFYDAGTRLVITAAAAPEALCVTGPHKNEFLRTASRLREMQSKSWWGKKL